MKNKKTIIRKPKKNDFLKMCRLLNKADKPYQKIIPNYEKFTISDLKYMKEKSKRSFLIIEYGKKITGLAVWSIKNKNICWLSILHIEPKKQKLGFGTKLLKETEKRGQKKGCIYFMLEIFPKAKWAKNFYLKNNYQILSKKDYKKKIFKNILSPKTKTLVMIKKRESD